ncbi:hybrid sensor histidine kinase/response regulator [Salipiger mucosus]|uniref:histidine kinase n=1 Tax=Salipiger mucosus DSM 16094 TaxID=1123237 RepID=S9QL77_9RHOB|nr:ATP-binding protein [Salipiger mucosus]EPX80522.1 Sensory box histidine kinase/response regulator [Salipiger mucosus DSM 16094]
MSEPAPQTMRRRWRILSPNRIAVTAVVFCVGLVAGMAASVLREIDELSTANSDNLQWSLAQADVEFLRLRLALEQAQQDRATLDEVRRRFDIFYSRVGIFDSGTAFRTLRSGDEYAEPRAVVQRFLDDAVPLIDGPDPALRDALPELSEAASAINEDVRAFSLAGLTAFAETSDNRRQDLVHTLIALAVLLALVFVGLVLISFTLYRMSRQDQARAEEIQRTGRRMQAIVDTALDAILVTDAEGTIREFNPAARRIFGYDREEALGRNAGELIFPPEVLNRLRGGELAFVDTPGAPQQQERRFEEQALNRDGHRFPAEISVVRAESGKLFVAYIRDISRRRAAEDGLTEARDRALAGERAKAEFLAVMSHEMRTPLNGMLGTMQLMRDHTLTERQSDLLDRMQTSGSQLLGLVNDVLDLSKFEAGKVHPDQRPFSVTRLLDGVVETASPLAAAAGTTLEWQWVGQPADAALGDSRRLRQVLLNLVGNAVKFTRGGSVDVEAERLGNGKTLEFRVIDTGIGIAEADLDRIFEDFETLDSSYARRAGGTGLGLGIARRLTEAMGGEIGVESEPGEGSLFWIRLPLVSSEAEAQAETPAASRKEERPAVRPLDLLLVEDNEINRFVAREMLEAEGHKVTEALDGRAGVEWAEARAFDAILMDISMPVMDGPAAARHIREGAGASAKAPIIAVTAHALPEELARFREAGMAHCISKPVNRRHLLDTLAVALDEAGAEVLQEPVQEPEPLLDEAQIATLWKGLPDSARADLRTRFLAEMDAAIADLAALSPDDPDLPAAAHKCAGNCATFGLVALRGALGRIETSAKRGQPVDRGDLEALRHLWARSRTALEDRMEQAR